MARQACAYPSAVIPQARYQIRHGIRMLSASLQWNIPYCYHAGLSSQLHTCSRTAFGLYRKNRLQALRHMQASDNTRHKSVNPSTGEAFLLPAHDIRRVVLCTGQIYYHMSMARRTRRIRDIVLVRLEQIAPFPSDLLIKASLFCQTGTG